MPRRRAHSTISMLWEERRGNRRCISGLLVLVCLSHDALQHCGLSLHARRRRLLSSKLHHSKCLRCGIIVPRRELLGPQQRRSSVVLQSHAFGFGWSLSLWEERTNGYEAKVIAFKIKKSLFWDQLGKTTRMFPGFFTSPSKRRELYLGKEKELIELSMRSFGTEEEYSSPPRITTFDTLIPATDPKGHGYCRIDGKCSTYKIHGISVKSEQGNGVKKETTPIVLLHGYGASFQGRSFEEDTHPENKQEIPALSFIARGQS